MRWAVGGKGLCSVEHRYSRDTALRSARHAVRQINLQSVAANVLDSVINSLLGDSCEEDGSSFVASLWRSLDFADFTVCGARSLHVGTSAVHATVPTD